jgi:hypothetical protein
LRGYLDKYSIKESIADETTLPIKHVLAPSTMTVAVDRLDREFFALAGAEDVTDIEELNKVLDRAVGLRTYADGCRATSISTGHPTRRSSSPPTSPPVNAAHISSAGSGHFSPARHVVDA